MKKVYILSALIGLFAAAITINAQQVPSISRTMTAENQTLVLSTNGLGAVAFQFSGGGTAEVYLEGSVNCIDYVAINAYPPRSTTPVSYIYEDGIWLATVAGMQCARATLTDWYSDPPVTITMSGSQASARSITSPGIIASCGYTGGLLYRASATSITCTGNIIDDNSNSLLLVSSTIKFTSNSVSIVPDGTAGHRFSLGAYDTDDSSIVKCLHLDNGGTVALTTDTSGGCNITINATTIATPSLDAVGAEVDDLTTNTITYRTNGTLDTDSTTAHTLLFRAWDVDGAVRRTFITATNGNTPDMTIAVPTGSTLVVQASTYKSSDGSTGVTVAACTSFKNGLCVAGT